MDYYLNDSRGLNTKEDVMTFFKDVLDYRSNHKDESVKIARFVFDATHKNKLGSVFDDDIETVRNEFGALEAPGLPDDGTDPDIYVDKLWDRLRVVVGRIKA